MHDLKTISNLFDLRGDFVHGHVYGSGHINDTYCVWVDQSGLRVRYILQRINHNIFKQPVTLMNNVARVTAHAIALLQEEGNKEAYRRTLTLVPTRDGKPFAQDSEGNVWRVYPFIERARGYDIIENLGQAEQAAKAFGAFQKLGASLPGEPLEETIPNFHNTTWRLQNLKNAIAADKLGRAASVQKEIEFFLAREADATKVVSLLESGELPVRVTHNDTKLNNVLLDDVSGEGVCVIDLDTTMPGSAIYDFGDMIRTATSPAAEDEKDLSKVTMRMEYFDALVKGYLSSANAFLTDLERSLLAFSGKLLTLECGMRFLTDYLEGDVYFKIKHEHHNLDRCRTQIALVESIEAQLPAMEALVEKYSR